MKKIARILMIAAVAVAGLSAVGFLITVLFQRYFVEAMYGGSDQLYFMVPMGDMIACFGSLAVALGMLFVVCDDRYPLKLDAICAGVLAVGLPLIADTASYVQSRLTSRLMDMDAVLYYSRMTSMCNLSQSFCQIVTALTLVACGMSIAVKYLTGKSDFSCK